MATRIATYEDLQVMKDEILSVIKKAEQKQSLPSKRWIRNHELVEILGISSSSLQNLRNNGTIPFTKLSGVIYYDMYEIDELLSNGLKENLIK